MVNRCDSIDALRYAYYEMMRIKEENQMLEKNKDYVEFTLQYTSVDWERRSKDCPEVCLKGYSDFSFPGVPIMDVVCNEFDHKVVVVSKRDFEKMQADVNINAEIAKQWEKLWSENKKCEKRIEALLSEIREWKNITGCSSPESYMAVRLNAAWQDVTGEQIFGRDLRHTLQVDLEYYRAISSAQAKSIYCWKEATGCPTPEAAKTLIESGMSYEHGYHEVQEENRKLTEEVDSWKNVTGQSTPEDYMHARISGAFHTPFDYTSAWQKATDCNAVAEGSDARAADACRRRESSESGGT